MPALVSRMRAPLRLPAQRAFARCFSSKKVVAAPMTYISGEEMSWYVMKLVCEKWVDPFVDTSKWEYFDLSCKGRDATKDKVLHDAVASGAKLGAIFKEPTITPTADQVKSMGLSKAWGSPNGAMRRGWNGITISRDTIHIPGIELGFKRPVLFERHAVGGEYGAGWSNVGKGRVLTTFFPRRREGEANHHRWPRGEGRAERGGSVRQSSGQRDRPGPHLLLALPRGRGRALRGHEEDRVQVAGGLLAEDEGCV